MPSGFAFAFSEISLVLFTTLAPSGAIAFALMAIPLFRSSLDAGARRRLSKLLCIPLVVTMVGLIASATHLGNPDNALYVLAGVGRSPLSTEVVCAVAFLALAGVYWLLTFSLRFPLTLQRVWLAVAMLFALAFVWAVAFAYGRETILTWDMWQVPAALCLNSLVGGPLLALAGFRAARVPTDGAQGAFNSLFAVSLCALLVCSAVYISQGIDLAGMRTPYGIALDRVPGFAAAIAGFFACGVAGAAVMAASGKDASASYRRRLCLSCVGCALAFAGIFLMRFVFYMTHLTVGLGI